MFASRAKKLVFLLFLCSTSAHAQYELPNEIFERTLLIRSGDELATAFKFDHAGHIYLVTTRHLAKTLPLKNAVLQVWHGSWINLQTTQTLLAVSKDVDLAIFETGDTIERPYKVVQSSGVLTTGQKVWYMGWTFPVPRPRMPPTPLRSRPLFPEIPTVKIGMIAAIQPTRPDSLEIHVDGIYNLRMASGPIVYWSPVHRDFEVLGVIERNERDAEAGTAIYGNPPQKTVKSGILKAYSIDIVTDIINTNPDPLAGR